MVIIKLDVGPTQKMITEELIEGMINWVPRRFRLCDFDKPLKPPKELGDWQEDWNLRFPFQETFVPSFQEMCPSVDHIPFTSKGTAGYVAMLLLEAGAKKVFGLSCEKTCSNDDNVSRR